MKDIWNNVCNIGGTIDCHSKKNTAAMKVNGALFSDSFTAIVWKINTM